MTTTAAMTATAWFFGAISYGVGFIAGYVFGKTAWRR